MIKIFVEHGAQVGTPERELLGKKVRESKEETYQAIQQLLNLDVGE